LISLSIAIYEKAFTSTDTITLKTDHTGNQLILDSDVKVNGLIVGSVSKVKAAGLQNSHAVVTMAIDPDKMKDIPDNVRAVILPKTLFGEQYVSLVIPADQPIGSPIKSGAVIGPDRSHGALEAQDVLGDLLPLLQAVKPAELNETLNAIATALRNKGPELGRVLTNFDKYLKIMNPQTTQLVDDIKKLGQVSLEYNNLAPDLFATLRNLETSARTVVQKRTEFDQLLTSGSATSAILQSFLSDNRDRLIAVSGQTVKIYGLLQQYSPEFKCLLIGITKLNDLANQAIYNHEIHLSATVDTSNIGPYKLKSPRNGQPEVPHLITGLGPHCFGLPDNPQPTDAQGHFQIPPAYHCLNDGAGLTKDAEDGTGPCAGNSGSSASDTTVNSPEENALVNSIIASRLHTTPDLVDGTATLLAGPLLRGNKVVIR
jgi:virulence factor Mce-like protein